MFDMRLRIVEDLRNRHDLCFTGTFTCSLGKTSPTQKGIIKCKTVYSHQKATGNAWFTETEYEHVQSGGRFHRR